jgi:hypothetical protein
VLRRIAASPVTAIVASVLAVAVIVTGTILWTSKFFPPAADYSYEQAPSAFPVTLTAASSPALKRGETFTLSLQAYFAGEYESVELWDGDRLYLRQQGLASVDQGGAQLGTASLDFVPLVAGVHVLMARVVATNGQVAQSAPVTIAVLDSPQTVSSFAQADETGSLASTVTVHSVEGDTDESLAARLGVTVDQLQLIGAGPSQFHGKAAGVAVPISQGTLVTAPLVSASAAKALPDYGYALDGSPLLTATVTDCVVTISLVNFAVGEKVALYASTPLHAGFARIGDVAKGAPFVSSSMPIGPSTLIAYKAGATGADTSGENAPGSPVTVTVPETCASAGWTGDAKIVNGVLLTDAQIEKPYAYVSIDGKQWNRVPAAQDQFLPTGSFTDVRSYLALDRFDQVNIQVWSSASGTAVKMAEGDFCRKSMPNADPSKSSGTGGACRPPGNLPGESSKPGANALSLYVTTPDFQNAKVSQSIILPGSDPDPTASVTVDPQVNFTVDLAKDVPVTFTASSYEPEFDRVIFQFSYFPISAASTTLNPPGIIYSTEMSMTTLPKEQNDPGLPKRKAVLTVSPWQWRNSTLPEIGDSTFATDGGNLELSDEIAASVARANLEAGNNLVDTLYVRAVGAQSQYYAKSIPANVVSTSAKVSMTDPALYSTFTSAVVTLEPGRDTVHPDTALRNKCFSVQSFPEANSWNTFPGFGPSYQDILVSMKQTQPGNQYFSDKAVAERYWDLNMDYCLDPNADTLRYEAAKAAEEDCSWFCVFTSIVLGATVGLLLGGPAGAIAGAMLGSAMALGAGSVIAEYYALLAALWDEIAKTYNTIYDTLNTLVAKFNPICLQAAVVSKKAGDVCVGIAKSVQAAVVQTVTGLPPQVPTSEVLEQIADGKLDAALQAGMDVALGQLGLSCDTLTLKSSASYGLSKANSEFGNQDSKAVLDAATTSDGSLSACKAFSSITRGMVYKKLAAFQGTQVAGLAELTNYVEGTVLTPVTDTSPEVHISAKGVTGELQGSTCPVYTNVTLTIPYFWSGSDKPASTTFKFKPIQSELKFRWQENGPEFYGEVPIPVLPGLNSGINPDILVQGGQKAAAGGEPYMVIDVDSPCLEKSYQITASKNQGLYPAFIPDENLVTYYW